MKNLELHHDHILKILAGHSLTTIPWTIDEDQQMLEKEMILFNYLSAEDKKWETDFLNSLRKSENRVIQANPQWGDWAKGSIVITDEAFGPPRNAFLSFHSPQPQAPQGFEKSLSFLWERGFRVSSITPGVIRIWVHTNRWITEAQRLKSLLENADISVMPLGCPYGVQIRTVYDPVLDISELEVLNLRDNYFC